MSWDAFQREVLAEMGHVAWHAAGEEAAEAPRDALSLAVLRAAARTADSTDAARLCREHGVPARLRGAAAKRALWPQLRALRRAMQ